jgi:HrpA-like RNA helicase
MEKDLENFIKASEDRLKTEKMPLLEYREAILQALLNNQCLVLQADTELGKTTQLPQYLYLDCCFRVFKICITQPRLIVAYSVAKRVSEEFNYNNISKSCLSIRELSSVSNTPIVYSAAI